MGSNRGTRRGPGVGDQTEQIALSKGEGKVRTNKRQCDQCRDYFLDSEYANHRAKCILGNSKEEEEKNKKFESWRQCLYNNIVLSYLSQVSGSELKKLCENANKSLSRGALLREKVEEKIRSITKQDDERKKNPKAQHIKNKIKSQEKWLRAALASTLKLKKWNPNQLEEIWAQEQKKSAKEGPKRNRDRRRGPKKKT